MSDEYVPDISPLENEIFGLVVEFVDRIQIVHEALFELHPRLIWQRWCKENPHMPRTKADFTRIFKQNPQVDIWKNEWDYFIHGIGCRLINIHTRECLEWDMGKKNSFDKYWLVNWLLWRLEFNPKDSLGSNIRQECSELNRDNLREVVFPILGILYEKGLLFRKQGSHQYLLK